MADPVYNASCVDMTCASHTPTPTPTDTPTATRTETPTETGTPTATATAPPDCTYIEITPSAVYSVEAAGVDGRPVGTSCTTDASNQSAVAYAASTWDDTNGVFNNTGGDIILTWDTASLPTNQFLSEPAVLRVYVIDRRSETPMFHRLQVQARRVARPILLARSWRSVFPANSAPCQITVRLSNF